MPQSIFAGLARDATQRALSADISTLARPNEAVLFHSTFGKGFAGWRDHFDGTNPVTCLSLTNYPTMHNERALKLATGARPYVAGNADVNVSTYKNLSQYRTTGLVSMSAWLVAGGGGAGTGNQAGAHYTYSLAMDIQKWDETSRSFPRLYCVMGGDGKQRWAIEDDANAFIYIVGATDITAGLNENKYNWNYVRLTWDLDANGGRGGYYEAQINHKTFDLRGLGGGSADHDPQAGNPDLSFSGGLNFGLTLRASSANPDLFPAWLVADSIIGTIHD